MRSPEATREGLRRGIDLAVLEPVEAYALRAILEYEGLRVNWFPIATWGQLRHLLTGEHAPARHLVICCHGDEQGIVLEGLAPEDVPPARLTPELVRRHASLHGCVVVVTGCVTGSAEMARAFLDAGCAAYIAPDGCPQSALLFPHRCTTSWPPAPRSRRRPMRRTPRTTMAGSSGSGRQPSRADRRDVLPAAPTLPQPALEVHGDDPLVVHSRRLVRRQPHDRRPHH